MELTTLKANARSVTGKGAARKLRATGRIPATVYGRGIAPITIDLDPGDITTLRHAALGWNTPLTLNIEGAADVPLAILRDVQKHPLTGAVLHADFLRVDAEQQIEVSVRIDLEGRAEGVAQGGLMNRPIRRLTVRCLPSEIPAAVSIDVTDMARRRLDPVRGSGACDHSGGPSWWRSG
jgi:large subunit ribosomal protein L25